MTVKLTPIRLDENTVIYIEATESVDAPDQVAIISADDDEESASSKGIREDAQKHFQDLQSTILKYTSYTLAAFKKVAVANIDKVTLEFGVEIGGEVGIPYITKGTAKSNLKIQVECSFTDNKKQNIE
jgi:hypothetical protein